MSMVLQRFKAFHVNSLRGLFVVGSFLVIDMLALGIAACGGGSSNAQPGLASYTLSATILTPASVTAGNSAASTITVTPANGYTGVVNLSCGTITGGSPPPSCIFNPSSVTISSTEPVAATLTVSSSTSTPNGRYIIPVAAADANNLAPSGGLQALTLTVAATLGGYTLSATSLTPASVTAGNSTTSTITVTPANGYTGVVGLSCATITGGSSAPSCFFNPSSVTISSINPGPASLTVFTETSTPVGRYTIPLAATDANNLPPSNGPQALTLTIVAVGSASYSLNATALSPASVTAGNSAASTITVTPANGYTGIVSLSCGAITGGSPPPNCIFNPSSVTISSTKPGPASLIVSTTTNTPGGKYTIPVTALDAKKLAPSNGPQALTMTTAAAIQHVVLIIQENRTPDNLFQDPVLIARGADIVASGVNSLGKNITLTPIDLGTVGTTPQDYDLGHKHLDFVAMYDNGKMDGADLTACGPAASCPPNANPNPQFKYVMQSDVQPYFTLAEKYTFGDRMFQTNEGPSFPAHQFILSGTSAPTATSTLFAADNPPMGEPAGCIAPPTSTVIMVDATGSETNSPPEFPCFEHATLTDLLDARGVTWRYYTPTAGSIWSAPDAIEHICQQQNVGGTPTCMGSIWANNVVIPQSQVLVDIANGQLPQVSWIIPDGKSSDHALLNDGSGPAWVTSIVNAIGNSAYWANTAIIISWDDWGGWFDHVAPTVINNGVSWGSGYVYGFRVPLLVVSPYARASYISHVKHDFGSLLKFVEKTYDLPSLGYADGPADDLADCFDLTQTPLKYQIVPTSLNAAYFINDKRPATDPDDD